MLVSDLLSKCLHIVNCSIIVNSNRKNGQMGQIMLDIEYVQLIHSRSFRNDLIQYLWMVTHLLLLQIYPHHCVNIAIWLRLSKRTTQWRNCYHVIADIWTICPVNFKYFGYIVKNILYDNTLLLEGGACSYKQETILDFYTHVVDDKIVTGIYHKVQFQFRKNWLSLFFGQLWLHA